MVAVKLVGGLFAFMTKPTEYNDKLRRKLTEKRIQRQRNTAMRQKKKDESGSLHRTSSTTTQPEAVDKPEACVKCAKLQNGTDDPTSLDKPSTLNTLKSVLKRTSSTHKKTKDKSSLSVAKRHKNHVTFDETQNKYFDADYVILIHEEEYDFDDYYDEGSPYDDEDDEMYDDEVGHKMCCSNPNCSNMISMGYYPEHQGYRYDYGGQYFNVGYQKGESGGRYEKCGGCDEEFVVPEYVVDGAYSDHVTLSPPEGYKDGGCPHHGVFFPGGHPHSPTNEDNDSKAEMPNGHIEESKENASKEDAVKQRFIVETITMTTVTERRIVRETEETGKKMGILKGGKLWKTPTEKPADRQRSVNYNEVIDYKENEEPEEPEIEECSTSFNQNDEDAKEKVDKEEGKEPEGKKEEDGRVEDTTVSPESTELTLTFKLGQNALAANNSLKPNSAVRQLFPSPRFLSPPPQDEEVSGGDKSPKHFLVTAESLRMFEEAKKAKGLVNINEKVDPGFISLLGKDEEDKRVRRIIERNTLRRSLIRYPCDLRSKRLATKKKNEHSLEERIKQLTCNIDDEPKPQDEVREAPQGEEAQDEKATLPNESPTPSTNSSSSSSGTASTYKKITEILQRPAFPMPIMEDVNCNINQEVPDNFQTSKAMSRVPISTEARKQFLSTLGPLTACMGNLDGKEYSLEDIDVVLKAQESRLGAQPDIIAGTPQSETTGDELALFAQQEANRTDKIKKRYSIDDKSDDDDDYGFNKRPTVKGIKPRFGTTQEIVQQIQEGTTMWPYYSQNTPQRATNLLYRSPSVYSSNSSLYQQPMRIAGSSSNYAELPNFHFRHPPQSPPPARHRMSAQPAEAPDPIRPGAIRNPESVFYRRTVPNVQMQFTPVGYPVPGIRFSATACAPRPVVDESRIIIEPHYSTLPRPAVIRVGQGQQMIRVPVPYASGAPVQVHLMTRRCDSPQRPNSPQLQPPQYLIAKGTQTAQHLPDGAEEKVDFEAQGKAIAEELQTRGKLARSLSQDGASVGSGGVAAGFQSRPLGGRGAPEGAASCAAQDAQISDPVTGNTVYYSMNV